MWEEKVKRIVNVNITDIPKDKSKMTHLSNLSGRAGESRNGRDSSCMASGLLAPLRRWIEVRGVELLWFLEREFSYEEMKSAPHQTEQSEESEKNRRAVNFYEIEGSRLVHSTCYSL